MTCLESRLAFATQILINTAREYKRPVLASALGEGSVLLIHLLEQHGIPIPVVMVDTGYLFQETLDLLQRVRQQYPSVEISTVAADDSVTAYEAANGGPVYVVDGLRCCAERKLAPLRGVLAAADVWVTGIRRDQAPTRAACTVQEWSHVYHITKVNPLALWTADELEEAVVELSLPKNALRMQGYGSVGCWPCTKPGQGREGRWAGQGRTECGLHG